MKITGIIFALVMGGLLTVEARPPNIVFIVSDDQDWQQFGFTGGDVCTPNLDRMVDEGLWLTDFNVTSTVCPPSRYSFLTGRYAGTTVDGASEDTLYSFEIPTTELVNGSNVLAVEIHQKSPTSSDLSFAASLTDGSDVGVVTNEAGYYRIKVKMQ